MINHLKKYAPKPLKRVIFHAWMLRKELPPFLKWTWRMRGDSLFKLVNIDAGLKMRPTTLSRTPEQRLEVAQRVIDAYRLASTHQKGKSSVYTVSNEWIPIFQKPLQPLLESLNRGDAVGVRDLMDNFFRCSISAGLIGLAIDMFATFFDKKKPSLYRRTQLLIDHVYRYRLLKKLLPDISPEKLHIEDIGNPYGLYVEGKFVRTGADYQYYYADQVNKLLNDKRDHTVVAELGGGIGGFAHFLLKARSSGLTYINLDLPEILCIASYQLLNLFPEKNIVLYGEIENINTQSLSGYDIALLPCFVVETLATDSVDVVFNSYSLAEMDAPTIENYAKQFSRICRHAILHVNHVRNSLVSANDFPFDAEKFLLVSKTRAEWNIGRDLQCDEYEFAYHRITETTNKLFAKDHISISP